MQDKVEEKQAWKVLSDPHAEERYWIAACKVVGAGPKQRKKQTSRSTGLADQAHAWLTSLVGTFGGFGTFFFGFTVLNVMTCALGISDELTTFSRWFSFVLAFICWPAAACALVGLLQRGNRPEVKHSWLLPLLVPVGLSICASIWNEDISALLVGLAGLAASRMSYRAGFVLSGWWRKLGSPSKLFAPYVWTITSVGVLLAGLLISTLSSHSDPHVQSSVSSGITSLNLLAIISLVSGIVTANSCRSQRLATKLAAALTMQLPTICLLGYGLVAGLGYGLSLAVSGRIDFTIFLVAMLSFPVMIFPSLLGAALTSCVPVKANRANT